jgi:pyruvate/2-oxoglutarate dehydrogenase complex dihydrolipoamide dehydrogenase (E3) component
MTKYDAILVGSGQAANPLARKLAAAGWKTALIERQWVGGTCVNVGCTPTKTMIASGRVAYLVKRSAEFGIRTAASGVDVETFLRRKNSVVLTFREGSTKSLLNTPHLDLIFGTAAFSGSKEIAVVKADGSSETLTADYIFLNAGAHPFIPPIRGLDDIPYLTSSSILDLHEIPTHLAIIGGGYVALEFGQLYRRLGSQVTIVEHNDRFLPREDEDIAAEIRRILEEDGMQILTGTGVTAVAAVTTSTSESGIRLDLEKQASKTSAIASHVLVASGRRPDTAGLNVAAAGIRLDEHGYIAVNGRLETNVPGIFALGDVKGGPQFTHVSWNDHLIVYKNLIEKAKLSIENRVPVYCLFTDPELGRVGLTENEARAKGINIKVATMPASYVARAYEIGETRGLLKVIVNADDRKILGAAMLISGGGELMSIVQMAMTGGVTYDTVRDGMYAHPTFAESLNNLFAKL